MRFLRLLLVALATLVLALFVGSNGPASAQPACGTVTANTTLAGDCTGPMIVAASNIRIDLNGFAVKDSASQGILIVDQTNVRVENGSVTNNGLGISIAALSGGGGGHHLRNLQVTKNKNVGIIITASNDRNKLIRNTITGNAGAGILAFSESHIILGNITNNNNFGILVANTGQNDRILNNTALGNNIRDLHDDNATCDNNLWKNNTFNTANQTCIR